MKGIKVSYKGRKASKGWAIKPVSETLMVTDPDEFNEVIIIHPEGFSPNTGELSRYKLKEEELYVWVQLVELKIIK